jgi:hypothetical protein
VQISLAAFVTTISVPKTLGVVLLVLVLASWGMWFALPVKRRRTQTYSSWKRVKRLFQFVKNKYLLYTGMLLLPLSVRPTNKLEISPLLRISFSKYRSKCRCLLQIKKWPDRLVLLHSAGSHDDMAISGISPGLLQGYSLLVQHCEIPDSYRVSLSTRKRLLINQYTRVLRMNQCSSTPWNVDCGVDSYLSVANLPRKHN